MNHSTMTPRHPLLACADVIEKALASVVDCDPMYLDPGDRGDRGDRGDLMFTPAQRRALALPHPHCRAEDCDVPAPWTEAHHATPWSRGGKTDLEHGLLLCHWHHKRAHDLRYRTERLPNGDVRYHRRT